MIHLCDTLSQVSSPALNGTFDKYCLFGLSEELTKMSLLIFLIPFIDSVICSLKLYYIKLLTKKKEMQMKTSKDNVMSPWIHNYTSVRKERM